PPASSAVSDSSITSSWPKIARPISLRTRPKRSIVVSTSSRMAVSSFIDRPPMRLISCKHMAIEGGRANLTWHEYVYGPLPGSTPAGAVRPHESVLARDARTALTGPAHPVGRHLAVSGLADPAHRAGQAVRLRAAARGGRQLLAGHPGRARPDRGG